MFDFGFSEMVLVAVVALIVVGPQRLPKVARTAGHLLGRLQRYVAEVKSDVSREMQLEELKKLQQQVKDQAQELESTVRKQADGLESSVRDTAADIERSVEPVEPGAPPMNPPSLAPVTEASVLSPAGGQTVPPEDSQLQLGLGDDAGRGPASKA
ncbi:MAG: Sec-independent protein translocase protein TatB [Pseudazoarcus pumilus]|nr:Sec-independent protein translocase protein TatB [Pseudazoarcus pumilus]